MVMVNGNLVSFTEALIN